MISGVENLIKTGWKNKCLKSSVKKKSNTKAYSFNDFVNEVGQLETKLE